MNNLVEKISNAIYNNYEEGNEAKAALEIIEIMKKFLLDEKTIEKISEQIMSNIKCDYSDSFIAANLSIETINNLMK